MTPRARADLHNFDYIAPPYGECFGPINKSTPQT